VLDRQPVAGGEPGSGDRPARAQEAQRQALDPVDRVERAVEREIGRADPRASSAREIERHDATLGRERGDHLGAVGDDALGDLVVGQVAEIVQDSRELVRVASAAIRCGLLELRLHGGDDLGSERAGRHRPRLAHRDRIAPALFRVTRAQIRPVPRQQQRVDERRGQGRVDVTAPHLAVVHALEQPAQARRVERVVEALAERLGHDRELGLAAHRLEQRVGLEPLQVGRRALAAVHARDEERTDRTMTEARAEERRADQRLAEERVDLLGRDERDESLRRGRHLARRER